MEYTVTVDDVFAKALSAAENLGATQAQLDRVNSLKQLIERTELDVNPFKKAVLLVEIHDHFLKIIIKQADENGNPIIDGHWCRVTIDHLAMMSVTTSKDPVFIHIFEE